MWKAVLLKVSVLWPPKLASLQGSFLLPSGSSSKVAARICLASTELTGTLFCEKRRRQIIA
jgi:hypothetical protein